MIFMERNMKRNEKNNERGYTLLEYCAGAALIAGIIWVALNTMGQNVSALLNAIGQWAASRTGGISQ